MRWPWSERRATAAPAAVPLPVLRCDECVSEPRRIRQMLHDVVRERSRLTLVGRDLSPVHAHTRPDAIAHDRLKLRVCNPFERPANAVTALTRLSGIDLVFSGHLQATPAGDWAIDMPDELLYLNMRACFRALGRRGETVCLRGDSGREVSGKLTNLSEDGACFSLSAVDAQRLTRQAIGWQGELQLRDGDLPVGPVHLRHATPCDGAVRVGVSFLLAEGWQRQRLRQTLHRRQTSKI